MTQLIHLIFDLDRSPLINKSSSKKSFVLKFKTSDKLFNQFYNYKNKKFTRITIRCNPNNSLKSRRKFGYNEENNKLIKIKKKIKNILLSVKVYSD